MNNLEKYILENRDDFDRVEDLPEEAMWQNIRPAPGMPGSVKHPKRNAKTQRHRRWKILAITAFLLALTGWGTLFFKKQSPVLPAAPAIFQAQPETPLIPKEKTPATAVSPPMAEAPKLAPESKREQTPSRKKPSKQLAVKKTNIPAEWSQEESQFQQLVNRKKGEIGFEQLDRKAFADLFSELDELEISVGQARTDAAGLSQNERLTETLMKYYELKIRILEQLSYEINKKKYHEGLEKSI